MFIRKTSASQTHTDFQTSTATTTPTQRQYPRQRQLTTGTTSRRWGGGRGGGRGGGGGGGGGVCVCGGGGGLRVFHRCCSRVLDAIQLFTAQQTRAGAVQETLVSCIHNGCLLETGRSAAGELAVSQADISSEVTRRTDTAQPHFNRLKIQ